MCVKTNALTFYLSKIQSSPHGLLGIYVNLVATEF